MAPILLWADCMIQSVLGSLRFIGLTACVCVVSAALGGYAFSNRSSAPVPLPEAHPAGWLSDVGNAIDCARAKQKDLLFEFAAPTVSSSAAQSHEATVLDAEPFRRSIGDKFILVRLAPTSEMSPAELTEVTSWAQRLGVARFPTLVLLDADARPYAKTELLASDTASYQKEFQRLLQAKCARDQALARAAGTYGIERARNLDRALAAVAPFVDSEYGDVERQIIHLDPQNVGGLKAKYESSVVARDIDSVMQTEIYPLAERGKYGAATARLDRLIAQTGTPGPRLQQLIAFKGQLYSNLGDKERAARLLDDAIAIDPQSESAAQARAARLQLARHP